VDVNSDGIVDDANLLTVLFNFGSSLQAQYLFVLHSTIGTWIGWTSIAWM